MSKWKEVRSNYYNEEEKATYIDAWKTLKSEEEGTVVAKVYDSRKVEYLCKAAITDSLVQEEIQEVLKELQPV